MSVIVKGMKMPQDCFECPLSISPINDDSLFWKCGANAMSIHEASTEEYRPYQCPLEEVIEEASYLHQEKKKGKWIDETFEPFGLVFHPYKCNQCGEHSETNSNFCPNCGADMREKDE